MTDVDSLLSEVGLPPAGDSVTVDGADPVIASPFRAGEAAATVLGACGAAAAHLFRQRGGEPQKVSVSVTRAAASLVSFAFQRIEDEDKPTPQRTAEGNPLVALYQCGDGRWIHLHGSFPKLVAGTRRVLGDVTTREEVAAAVRGWESQPLEDALAEASTCGAIVRSASEWRDHPQGEAVATLARVQVDKIGESDPESLPGGDRPLSGVRVLDLTRVLAGPASGRTLAEHGADVLLVNGPEMPNVEAFVMDTSHGKLSSTLDLATAEGRARLLELATTGDVFCQGYRAGALERLGFGVEELAAARPGIIYVSINCYGDVGPWRSRPGWEQLAQSVSGIAQEGGHDGEPALIPAAACDYTTGYLAALGTMAALSRRATEGGSYHVRASLCQTARWIESLQPRCDSARSAGFGDTTPWTVVTETPWGRVRHLTPVVEMSGTPARWDRPTAPVGTHQAVWPTRD